MCARGKGKCVSCRGIHSLKSCNVSHDSVCVLHSLRLDRQRFAIFWMIIFVIKQASARMNHASTFAVIVVIIISWTWFGRYPFFAAERAQAESSVRISLSRVRRHLGHPGTLFPKTRWMLMMRKQSMALPLPRQKLSVAIVRWLFAAVVEHHSPNAKVGRQRHTLFCMVVSLSAAINQCHGDLSDFRVVTSSCFVVGQHPLASKWKIVFSTQN